MAEDEVELREVLRRARIALEEGRHAEALIICRHALRHYPEGLTALRLLGEALVAAGEFAAARGCFERALAGDPCDAAARIGLAAIAEAEGDEPGTLAAFERAWDLAPALPRLRDELARLYRGRDGSDDRVRLTRLGLANLHTRNDDVLRAINEFRSLLAELDLSAPSDPRSGEPAERRTVLRLGLAEALWRHEEDAEAAMLCRQVLAERPHTARAPLILAAIAGGDEAGTLLRAARPLDPDAALARALAALRPAEVLVAFITEPRPLPASVPAPAAPLPEAAAVEGRQAGTPALADPAQDDSGPSLDERGPTGEGGIAPLDSDMAVASALSPTAPEVPPFPPSLLHQADGSIVRWATSAGEPRDADVGGAPPRRIEPVGESAPAPPDQPTSAHDFPARLRALEELVAAEPHNTVARLTLAVAYGSRRPDQALTEYRRLIKEADDLLPEVIERLQELIADGVGGARAHRTLGDAYTKLGQFDLAMAEFGRALALSRGA